jgi:hypothetical protein
MNRFSSTVVITLALVIATPLAAQNITSRPFSLDFTVGLSSGSGGDYGNRHAPTVELTFTPPHSSAWVTSLTVGGHDAMVAEKCLGCRDHFPALAHFGLLGGLERAMTGFMARGALGPAFFIGEGAKKGLGPMARVDLAIGGFSHLGFVLVGQGELIIRSGETLRRGAIMFGVRIR